MPNPNDVFLDTLSEAKDVDLDEAILAIQTLDVNENRVWEYMRLYILSRFINERGHLFEDREPRQTDKREGEPSFFIEFGEDDDGDTTAALHFYSGEKGADWIEVASGGTGSSSDVGLPDLATDAQMASGTLTTRVGVSPHLVRHAIESYTKAFTQAEKTKLDGLADTPALTTAQIEDDTSDVQGTVSGERFKEGFDEHAGDLGLGDTNIQSDWDETDTTDHAFIENKPTTITQAQTDKLTGVETSATADQTDAEIATAMEGEVRDEHIASNLSDTEKSNIGTKIGTFNVSGTPSTGQVPKAQSDGTAAWGDDETASSGSGEDNVQSNWNTTDENSDSFIDNKPPQATDTEIEEADVTDTRLLAPSQYKSVVEHHETYPWAHSIAGFYRTGLTSPGEFSFKFETVNGVRYLSLGQLSEGSHAYLYFEELERHDEFAVVTADAKDELIRGEIDDDFDTTLNRIAVLEVPDTITALTEDEEYFLEFSRSIPDLGLTERETEDKVVDGVEDWALQKKRTTAGSQELIDYISETPIPLDKRYLNLPIVWQDEFTDVAFFEDTSLATASTDLQIAIATISSEFYLQVVSTSTEDIATLEALKEFDLVGIYDNADAAFNAFLIAEADWDSTNGLKVNVIWEDLNPDDTYTLRQLDKSLMIILRKLHQAVISG